MFTILALNPGSTSTKIGLFDDETCLKKTVLRHSDQELDGCAAWSSQADFRRAAVMRFLQESGINPSALAALVVRGGLLKPLPAGVYRVDESMYADLLECKYGRHASNLGGMIAYSLSCEQGIAAYTVDPVTVDEFADIARFSGLQGVPRLSMSHALNMKAMARQIAAGLGKEYRELNLVVIHLGGGISVSAHRRGRMIDVNNANCEGPFSMERCGTLPALALIDLCYSGRYTRAEMIAQVTSRGGVFSYLGTRDFQAVEERVSGGDREALSVVEAMAYQVGKEVGAMAAVLAGRVDRVVLTGGMAYSRLLTGLIEQQVAFIAPVEIVPGEEELEALAAGVLRVLRGEEEPLNYGLL
ncbi:MAG: butyrate kinase [Bacillota bacterium]